VTTSPAGDKLPNVNGLRDAQPRHSIGYRVQHRARTIVASVIAAMLVFSGTAAAATWLDVNGIIKNHSVELIGQGSLDANTSIIDPNSGKPIEFVLIGQDSRDGEENQSVGGNFDDVVGNHQDGCADFRGPHQNQPGFYSTRFLGGCASVRDNQWYDSRAIQRDVQFDFRERISDRR